MADHETPEPQMPLFDVPSWQPGEGSAHEVPDSRVSEAWHDLGGNPHELTLEEAQTLLPQGLGGATARRLAARAADQEFYNRQRGIYRPDDLPEDPGVPQGSSRRDVQAFLAQDLLKRVHKVASDDRDELVRTAAQLNKRHRHSSTVRVK
jgi:hypothetical protein